jgi:predicted lipid-binding transport protein (Tim44 family)
MGTQMPFVDILIFAVIAIFLIMRLRNILGSRDGFEQKQDNRPIQPVNQAESAREKKVVPLRPSQLDGTGLEAVRRADPNFSDDTFMQGAASAFGMVLSAFADGDETQLRRLLSFELYEEFSESIRLRNKNGDELGIEIISIDDVQLTDGQVVDNIASVTVTFVSTQTRTLTDRDGVVLEEDSMESTELTDIWVFERDTQLDDPNWKLVETRVPEEEDDEAN